MKFLPNALACIISIFLIFFANALKEHATLIICLLVLLSLLTLFSHSSTYSKGLSELSRSKAIFSLGLLCLFFSFAWAPFYFSDDALRHIHDGHYLLSGVDIYQITPTDLEAVLEQTPNHPELGSIYLPLTQAQAMLGALFSVPHGFRFVYIFFCVLLLAFIWLFAESKQAYLYLSFCFSPCFLIFLASHHADLQGFLLIGLIGVGLRACFTKSRPETLKACSSFLYLGLGFLAALLPGLKPEGLVWFLYLSLYFLSKNYFYFGQRDKSTKAKPLKKAIFFWFSGAALALGLQIFFAAAVLFQSRDSWLAFLETIRFFTDWFLAYNPILDLRTSMYEQNTILRPDIFAHYRKQVCAAALLSFFLFPGLLLLSRKRKQAFRVKEKKSQICSENLIECVTESFLKLALCTLLILKGAWNPWYLLWLLPALWNYPNYSDHGEETNEPVSRCTHFLTAAIPLFYIPVVQLRAKGIWQMQDFYMAFVLMGLFWFMSLKISSFRSKRAKVKL